ncbi:MAG: NAD-dependent succinate-semialdehyde dehydrogenase [Planctomycetota bacterium]|nr:NAD-dependent succinate-semialdehyde dehydrogenase [Planctomycetota bacterium]
MQSINPATEQIIGEYPDHSQETIAAMLAQACLAFESWRRTPISERAGLMRNAAKVLRERRDVLARLITSEMGKPITASETEVEKCAACCEFFADNAARFLAPREIKSDADRSFVRFDPLGPVLAIMPWNFPFWQVFRFAAPTLMAGNVAVLKHAPNVPGCAMAIERTFLDSGFPPGVFSSLLISDNQIAEQLVSRPEIVAVTLTGSERAGAAVASAAATALKKSVMELGGSDAFIVLADADLESVAQHAAEARCINNGQSCIAAKRFIVELSIAEKFESAMSAAMAAMKVGDPMDPQTQIGPLARPDLLDVLMRQVQRTIEQGATLLTGGHRLPGKGYYFEPTVLSNVEPKMMAFEEETFGPVAAIIRAQTVDDAVRLANLSHYGLGASIWTSNMDRAIALAEEIESGSVFINGMVKSDPHLPFGGIKNSGWGRELSEFGIHEFVNIKTVWAKSVP